MSNLTLEAFEGIGEIQPLKFYRYDLKGKGKIENVHQVIGKARFAISSRNFYKLVISKDDMLYTIEMLKVIPDLDEVEISYLDEVVLDIASNRDVYAKVIEYYINNKLRNIKIFHKYPKYKTQNTDEIIGHTILTRDLKNEFKSSPKGFQLKRKFNIAPVITDNGKVVLYLSCSSELSTKKTIYGMMQEGLDVVGLEVKNTWNNIRSKGTIEGISDKTISDITTLGQSLIDYYLTRNQGSRVDKFTEQDRNAKVIKVKMKKITLDCIPHALSPVITREYLTKTDKAFSSSIENLIKMDMSYRYNTLKAFVEDIGEIKELSGLSFKTEYFNDVKTLGYSSGSLTNPQLLGAKGVIKNKINIFNNGFYKNPSNNVKFGVMYPEGYEEASKKTMRAIYDFATNGKYNNEDNNYISNKLMNIHFESGNCIFESYKTGDITEYKKTALKLKKYSDIGLVIAIIPNINDNEDENPYSPFKRVWAELNIPSQMISLKTAELFQNIKGRTALYYLHNIALGILGKIGGIPWVIKDMQGDVDCFVGLDVGTREKGIHYPACSVIFDKYGKLINYYKPNIPQSGEIIQTSVLQEIFDNVLISYEEENGSYPKNIVIHRDGFSREDIVWYESYFNNKGIKFNIVEVRKNIPVKVARIENNIVSNPSVGSYLIKGNKAFIVTTDIKDSLGSPKPLKIEKTYGDIDIVTLINQIYALTQIHVGSTKSLRLPITTGYADKICKSIEFIPQGKLDNRLFFL